MDERTLRHQAMGDRDNERRVLHIEAREIVEHIKEHIQKAAAGDKLSEYEARHYTRLIVWALRKDQQLDTKENQKIVQVLNSGMFSGVEIIDGNKPSPIEIQDSLYRQEALLSRRKQLFEDLIAIVEDKSVLEDEKRFISGGLREVADFIDRSLENDNNNARAS